MNDRKHQSGDILQQTLIPYLERLRDPEVVAAADARTSASIVKMLLDSYSAEPDTAAQALPVSRREILNAIEELLRESGHADKAHDNFTAASRRICPEEDG